MFETTVPGWKGTAPKWRCPLGGQGGRVPLQSGGALLDLRGQGGRAPLQSGSALVNFWGSRSKVAVPFCIWGARVEGRPGATPHELLEKAFLDGFQKFVGGGGDWPEFAKWCF